MIEFVVDGPPRAAGMARSALLAADLVLIPATPSPFDGWASVEMLRLLDEARVFRPELVARMLLNGYAARPVITRETAGALADPDPPVLASRVGQRVAFAHTARTGLPVHQVPAGLIGGAGDRRGGGRDRRAPAMNGGSKRPLANNARLTINVTPELRGGIKVTAFRRGQTVADMLRAFLVREFPDDTGGAL